MSSSKSKPPKDKKTTKKTPLFVASKQDKKSEVQISDKSKVQPDYTKVKDAIAKVLNWLKEQKMPLTPWHESEFVRQTDMMAYANDPIIVYIVSTLEKSMEENKAEECFMSVETFVRPENSFLHSENPCPPAFMQRDSLFVDGVTANLQEHVKDPNFWWQPVVNVDAYAVAQAIQRLKERCELGMGVNFGGISNTKKSA